MYEHDTTLFTFNAFNFFMFFFIFIHFYVLFHFLFIQTRSKNALNDSVILFITHNTRCFTQTQHITQFDPF